MVAVKQKVRVLVLRAAGTNCDCETAFAFEYVGADARFVHVNELISGTARLRDYHILAIPGGFTYGDDIASGKILANELKYKLGEEATRFVRDGRLIIGICNGFQVLVKAGVLPGDGGLGEKQEATLTVNDSGRYEDRWVYLKSTSPACAKPSAARRGLRKKEAGLRPRGPTVKCVWTKDIAEIIYLPVAHGEGKFIPKDDKTLGRLSESGQIVFSYVDRYGNPAGFPHNPNGSVGNVAGICDKSGRIFGLMPHPERHIFALQHPRWTRGEAKREGDGVGIFRNGVKSV